MKKTILTIFILGVCATCYALNVGERTSFNSGIIVGGNTGFQPGGGEITATYWSTAMTDRWTDPMTALWSTTMNTEIP